MANQSPHFKSSPVRLTEYSHGAGCGCKIAPEVLSKILAGNIKLPTFPRLIVGNSSRDDAAVMDIGNGYGIISTTDFFMPVVDDPFSFGQIAATNAISDIYAMGGTPLMAIAILGWPVQKLSADIAATVVDGGRAACLDAGIPLAGGHSIDTPEPIFGLAVTGKVRLSDIKQNNTVKTGDLLFLTKPLGIGILSTAQKKQKLAKEHENIAPAVMKQLNTAGMIFSDFPFVHAMTDVTGFGLLGHLLEVCQGSNLDAILHEEHIPLLDHVEHYRKLGCIPGGTFRNFKSYHQHLPELSDRQKELFCDPQTSGGLLVAVDPKNAAEIISIAQEANVLLQRIGEIVPRGKNAERITIC